MDDWWCGRFGCPKVQRLDRMLFFAVDDEAAYVVVVVLLLSFKLMDLRCRHERRFGSGLCVAVAAHLSQSVRLCCCTVVVRDGIDALHRTE